MQGGTLKHLDLPDSLTFIYEVKHHTKSESTQFQTFIVNYREKKCLLIRKVWGRIGEYIFSIIVAKLM